MICGVSPKLSSSSTAPSLTTHLLTASPIRTLPLPCTLALNSGTRNPSALSFSQPPILSFRHSSDLTQALVSWALAVNPCGVS